MTTIKTPDQRLRVFVSSTIHELAAERSAATRAIEKLRLSPILFELGARPHPPRDLYRAYLDQSHIFVGIYWASYGWVSPGMAVSGLEDEYDLAGEMPKLIYVKAPSPDREERLERLLERIRNDNVSYKPFHDPGELQHLIENDLALLLTERFQSVGGEPVERDRPALNLPAQLDRFIGRQDEIDMGPEAFEAEWARGRALGLDVAAKIGLAWARGDDSHVTHDEEGSSRPAVTIDS